MAPTAPVPAAPVRTRRRPAFHALRVAAVERLCADAAAVSFEIPDELAGEFAFAPGQSLTLRREVDGRDERRSYSICAPAGSAPRIGVRVVPGRPDAASDTVFLWFLSTIPTAGRRGATDAYPPRPGPPPTAGARRR